MTDKKKMLDSVKFDGQGLVPTIVQDCATREVLMMAYMNRESLELTLDKGETYFYSRSRQEIWHKGETSGNLQSVQKLHMDCDFDTLQLEVAPSGPACHKGTYSCFNVEPQFEGFMNQLFELIERRKELRAEASYTSYRFNSGLDKILKKVGEEATETIVASKNPDAREVIAEASDLLYHLMVLLVERGISPDELRDELKNRHASKSGTD